MSEEDRKKILIWGRRGRKSDFIAFLRFLANQLNKKEGSNEPYHRHIFVDEL